MRVRQNLTKITISHPNSISPPVLPGACVEILEPKLGDVVSGDLCCLVNKLCEAATSSYYAVKSCPPTNDRFWRKAAVRKNVRSWTDFPVARLDF